MKGRSLIVTALVVIAITADFRADGLPKPQVNDDDFVYVDGFAFDGKVNRGVPLPDASTRPSPTNEQTARPTAAPAVVTPSPNVAQCTQNCRVTSEYNPVCGTDQMVYTNPGMLNCAKNCGLNVDQSYFGPCNSTVRG